jgi:hypothetical protein
MGHRKYNHRDSTNRKYALLMMFFFSLILLEGISGKGASTALGSLIMILMGWGGILYHLALFRKASKHPEKETRKWRAKEVTVRDLNVRQWRGGVAEKAPTK